MWLPDARNMFRLLDNINLAFCNACWAILSFCKYTYRDCKTKKRPQLFFNEIFTIKYTVIRIQNQLFVRILFFLHKFDFCNWWAFHEEKLNTYTLSFNQRKFLRLNGNSVNFRDSHWFRFIVWVLICIPFVGFYYLLGYFFDHGRDLTCALNTPPSMKLLNQERWSSQQKPLKSARKAKRAAPANQGAARSDESLAH